jgi:hypothetical protein
MSAQSTREGDQLVIHDPPARALWTRRTPPAGGRAWRKLIVLS